MAPRATYLILAASALDLSHALLGRGRHKSEHREHETRSRKTPDPDVVISEGAKKLEYQVRLGASDMKWPEGSFMSCLASRSREENKTYQMQQCLALNQDRPVLAPAVDPVLALAAARAGLWQ
ncbi:unnamed protein product [Prorocentrum cordatum]|uniref:Uncharacterized protein n=1 Tax=Prorocentrum cordatum TaxID=2364126 RepID=A0ABN9QBX8_9DINO|nr:unnamed protein product [Polarella glacialis]